MSNFISPIGLCINNGPSLADIRKCHDSWNDPKVTPVEFDLLKEAYDKANGVDFMEDGSGKPLTGKVGMIVQCIQPLSRNVNIILATGYVSAANLQGQRIRLIPDPDDKRQVVGLEISAATSEDTVGITTGTYIEVAYDAGSKLGQIVAYDNGTNHVCLLDLQELTSIDYNSCPPLPAALRKRVVDAPMP